MIELDPSQSQMHDNFTALNSNSSFTYNNTLLEQLKSNYSLDSVLETVLSNATTTAHELLHSEWLTATLDSIPNSTSLAGGSGGGGTEANSSNLMLSNDLHICHPENPQFNCSKADYLEFFLGPQQIPAIMAVVVS